MLKDIASALGLRTAHGIYLWNPFSPIQLALSIYLVEEKDSP